MIRYKVVNVNRGSCTVPLRSRKYYREYNKGDTVRAEKDSFGLMVFDTKRNALRFSFNTNQKILRVRSIGKALNKPKFLCGILSCFKNSRQLTGFYQKIKRSDQDLNYNPSPPKGTLFYEAVKVLD